MTDDIEIIHSPLTQNHSAAGHSVNIQIYRSHGSPWILEVEDEQGTSTVWDDPFETDTAALEAAFLAIEKEGIASFVTQAQQAAKEAEPELLRKLEALKPPRQLDPKYNMMMGPLSGEELEELDQFLLYLDNDESMTLDMLEKAVMTFSAKGFPACPRASAVNPIPAKPTVPAASNARLAPRRLQVAATQRESTASTSVSSKLNGASVVSHQTSEPTKAAKTTPNTVLPRR